jgi:hypothetical protein
MPLDFGDGLDTHRFFLPLAAAFAGVAPLQSKTPPSASLQTAAC